MFRKVDHKNMGRANHGWLNTHFHFSFANYYNPNNMNFGALRVINDDLVAAQTGFDMHPHRDMEIISYVVDGALTHEDSMGNRGTIERGHVQYMSAGTGVFHSEHNLGDETLRLLQIWILPDRADHKPNYGEFKFDWSKRENEWFHMVSSVEGNAPIQIHQDVNLYSLSLEAGKEIHFPVKEGRQLYLVQIEGSSVINGETFVMRDAAESVEEDIHIQAKEQSHYLAIELKKQ
ncbi:pirin family protein [Bacillus cereus]|uniref:Pirin family protein n=1 Tax=Bacillus cereus TaxID=1396 RepID=A0A9X8J0N7_BACCE|nr:pirin family protein [Bacillus cereus]RWQ75076.1 pirin family protein [Bacillus cereus]